MTQKARWLIDQMCVCQPAAGRDIIIYDEEDGSCTLTNSDTGKELRSLYPASETKDILEYLESVGWIRCPSAGIVTILHKGRYHTVLAVQNLFFEFIRSIFLPILTAFLTALLFSFLSARWGWFKV